jgi:hypothetical protein
VVSAKGVRPQTLVTIALVVGVLGWLLLRLIGGSQSLPTAGWSGVVLLGFMAAGVYWAGVPVQKMREGSTAKPISPLRAARTLVLAQAAALAGSALVGWYAAQALLLLPDLDIESQRARLWVMLGHLVVTVLLVIAGMITQRKCRVDPPTGPTAADGLPEPTGGAPAGA